MKNPVQNYPWGSENAISELLGIPNPDHKPMAEVWMGAHASASSSIVTEDGENSLFNLVQKDPEACLGVDSVQKFGPQLPFLLKILSAKQALSIQTHPNRDQALDGFSREEEQEISLSSPYRNYKDRNHKPELIYTLTPFWAMCGFRSVSEIIRCLKEFRHPAVSKAISFLHPEKEEISIRRFLEYILSLSKPVQKKLIEDILHQLHAESAPEHFWVAKLAAQFPGDIGALSPLFMNVVKLEPGHAMFLPAGELHAYLEGTGIEIMANSDNVLRGGLTQKHIDVPELLNTLNFKPTKVEFLKPVQINSNEDQYVTPASEYQLSRIDLSTDGIYSLKDIGSAQVLLCTRGNGIRVITEDQELVLYKGESLFVSFLTRSFRLEGDHRI